VNEKLLSRVLWIWAALVVACMALTEVMRHWK
jgi:hypothetical protein